MRCIGSPGFVVYSEGPSQGHCWCESTVCNAGTGSDKWHRYDYT